MSVPKIRFKGYTEPWKSKTVSDMAELTSSKRIHVSDYVKSGVPFYRCREVIRLSENKPITDKLYISEEKYISLAETYGCPQISDMLITALGYTGITWVADHEPFYFKDANLIWFRHIKCDSYYLYYLFNTDNGKKKVEASAITSYQPVLSIGKLNSLDFMFPAEEEQRKIASLFKYFDSVTAAHQKRLEKLKKIKIIMLQNFFPNENKAVPEIRFKGFNNAWQRKRFDEVFSLVHGLQIAIDKRYSDPGENRYLYITNELIRDPEHTEKYYIENPVPSVRCQSDDILITRTGYTGVVVTGVEGCFHNNYVKLRFDKTRYYDKFIYYYLSSEQMYRKMLAGAGGSSIPDLSHRSFYNIESFFPFSYEEQKKIGDYLAELDRLIGLQSRKLDILKKNKKYLLDKMFI